METELGIVQCLILGALKGESKNGNALHKIVKVWHNVTNQHVYRNLDILLNLGLVKLVPNQHQKAGFGEKIYKLTSLGEKVLAFNASNYRKKEVVKFYKTALRLSNVPHLELTVLNLTSKAEKIRIRIDAINDKAIKILLEHELDILNARINFAKKSLEYLSTS